MHVACCVLLLYTQQLLDWLLQLGLGSFLARTMYPIHIYILSLDTIHTELKHCHQLLQSLAHCNVSQLVSNMQMHLCSDALASLLQKLAFMSVRD